MSIGAKDRRTIRNDQLLKRLSRLAYLKNEEVNDQGWYLDRPGLMVDIFLGSWLIRSV
jgi:hypothetical protein